jgi:hypothetical protein
MSEHRPSVWHDDHNDPCDADNADAYCPACEEFWPCKASLQDRLAALEAALSVERIAEALRVSEGQRGNARDPFRRREAAALLAALDAKP